LTQLLFAVYTPYLLVGCPGADGTREVKKTAFQGIRDGLTAEPEPPLRARAGTAFLTGGDLARVEKKIAWCKMFGGFKCSCAFIGHGLFWNRQE